MTDAEIVELALRRVRDSLMASGWPEKDMIADALYAVAKDICKQLKERKDGQHE